MQNSTDFWADLDQVCLCSQELTERLEMEKGNQEIQATVFVGFFSLQDVPVKMGANSHSKILPQHFSMKARKRNHPKESNQQLLWSPWYEHGKMIIVDQKTRLQQKNFKIPHGVLGRLDLKTHSTLLVMISRARRASENPSLPLPVPLGAVVAQLRLLLAIGSACWAVSHRQPQAPSAEGFGCKPASAAEGN